MVSELRSSQARDLSRFLQKPWLTPLYSRMSPTALRAILGFIGWYYFHTHPRVRQALKTGLAQVYGPETGSDKIKDLARKVSSGLIDHYSEKLFLAYRDWETIQDTMARQVAAYGLEVLDRAQDFGRGVILVTGHFGAVEFLPAALARRGYPLSVMVHCKTQALRLKMEALADKLGIRLLDPKAGPVFYIILTELKAGRIVMTQCDEMEAWHPHRNHRIIFLGQDFSLDRSLDVLAAKAKAPVVFGLTHRMPEGGYRIILENPEKHPAAAGLNLVSAQCLAVLNWYIDQTPEAWYEWPKFGAMLEKRAKATVNEAQQNICIPGGVAVPAANPA